MNLASLPQPLILAHRGSSVYAPENTLAAFELAVLQGAPAVELDAKLTADGEIIVIHDATVDRTTNGTGKVSEYTLAELQELDAGGWFGPCFNGEKVPSLRQVFECLRDRVYINVELTNYATPADALIERVVNLIAELGIADQILFSSFSWKNITKARKLMPEIPCGLLAAPRTAWPVYWAGTFIAHGTYNPEIRDVTPRLLAACHRRKKPVFTYTVLDPADMRRLIDMGIDGLFVNDPLAGLAATGAGP
jgi:glycerophosphoryl diester phosphodiesterase